MRRKLPHEDLAFEIKRLVAEANLAASERWDDDMDQYYVGKAGFSPMQRAVDRYAGHMREAEALARKVLDLGPTAAEAVAKGLRTRGRWRELLLPYAEAHRDDPAVRGSLELLARREVDPLASKAAGLLLGH
jgi:hypothetical protein